MSILEEFRLEFPGVWQRIPYKGFFVACLVVWVLAFEFFGNSTFGYASSHSLILWANMSYLGSEDDEHGLIIPFLVLGLFWWKRKEFYGLSVKPWAPGLALVAIALAVHLAGYFVQQARVSLLAFFFGFYALIGLTWGPAALRKSFFPMCLFAFAVPLSTLAETITFPMRLLATNVTSGIAVHGLGIEVITQGTKILGPKGSFQYDVAPACGGLRSLTAVLALCTVYGFVNFQRYRNRFIMFLAAFPLAILGNITRLLAIIVVSEAFGQEAGQMVHDNTWFSLLPYVPPIIGIMVLGHFLRENKDERPASNDVYPENRGQPALQA